MKLSVKFIVIFVLLMLSFSVKGETVNFVVLCDKHYSDVCNSTSEVLESSSETSVLNETNAYKAYDDNGINTLSFSDIELGLKSLTETYSFSNTQRMRRAIELSDFFKGLVRALSIREDLLVLDRRKSYHSDKDPYMAQSGCEYYIFALRRILV